MTYTLEYAYNDSNAVIEDEYSTLAEARVMQQSLNESGEIEGDAIIYDVNGEEV